MPGLGQPRPEAGGGNRRVWPAALDRLCCPGGGGGEGRPGERQSRTPADTGAGECGAGLGSGCRGKECAGLSPEAGVRGGHWCIPGASHQPQAEQVWCSGASRRAGDFLSQYCPASWCRPGRRLDVHTETHTEAPGQELTAGPRGGGHGHEGWTRSRGTLEPRAPGPALASAQPPDPSPPWSALIGLPE